MFGKQLFDTLFAYHWHTTNRLLAVAAALSNEEYFAPSDFGHGSLHDLFFHLLRTDQGWRSALESGAQQPPLPPDDFPTLAALRTGFDGESAAWQRYLAGLSAEETEGVASLTTRRGDAFPVPRWRVLQHLILHGMQHHTEIAQLLTVKGHAPGDIDFIFYQ